MSQSERSRKSYEMNEERAIEIAGDRICKTVLNLMRDNPAFTRNNRTEALVSFVTPDYRWGMLAWLRSLRKVSDRPVILFTTRSIDIPENIENVFAIEVPVLFNAKYNPGRQEYATVLTKLWVFCLSCLDRVAFIDIDCLFLGNIDALFDSDQFLAVANNQHGLTSGRFNSGVMAFCPTENLRRSIFRKIGALESHLGGDEDALNQILIDEVVFVDEKYNHFRHFHFLNHEAARSDIRILHYVLKKPWEIFLEETGDAKLIYLDDLWTSFLSDQERSELISYWRKSVTLLGEKRIHRSAEIEQEKLQQRVAKLEKYLEFSVLIFLVVIAAVAAFVFWILK